MVQIKNRHKTLDFSIVKHFLKSIHIDNSATISYTDTVPTFNSDIPVPTNTDFVGNFQIPVLTNAGTDRYSKNKNSV